MYFCNMQRIQRLFIISILLLVILVSSCNRYQKILKKGDLELKYQTAFKLYEKEDYITTLQFLDELIPLYRGSDKLAKLMYIYPYCYMKNGDYMVAAYHFRQYARLFQGTPEAEECDYMAAYCSYLDSPPPSLEQENTTVAISELQLFVNKYPKSEKVAKCNELIDELRAKLSKKDFDIAKLYFNIESYNAASIAFNNLIKDYPDTKYREEASFYLVKNYYEYAIRSTDKKKKERFQKAIEANKKLIENFPQSKFIKESEEIAKMSQKQIEKIQ